MRDFPQLETLPEFWARTGGFTADSLPHSGPLTTNPNLAQKVSPAGVPEPFMGSTVVFTLPDEIKDVIGCIQDVLYESCGDILAEPLAKSSFHITLHDLVNGKPSPGLERRIRDIRERASGQVREIAARGGTVRLHSTYLFNMVNTSMVLGFAPADEESCGKLMGYYEALQDVVCLGYPLTPHVTLAYFRPGTIGEEPLSRLRQAVDRINSREKVCFELPVSRLEYQLFSSMNCYWRSD